MYIPASTYRVQLNGDFNFEQLDEQLTYLENLGVGCVYASPLFQAMPGSEHGYDVTDPHKLNPEIGSLKGFEKLVSRAQEKGMGWLQDIVPNHVAFDTHNPWVADVLESGPDSPFFSFFDIDWDSPNPALKGKVMLPFLGQPFEKCLQSGDLQLGYTRRRIYIAYFDNRYPVRLLSYLPILNMMADAAEEWDVAEADKKLLQVLRAKAKKLRKKVSRDKKDAFLDAFSEALQHLSFEKLLRFVLESINPEPEQIRSILNEQYYSLTYYKTTEKEINFRRFFTVNSLICMNMEDDRIFRYYHRLIKSLVRQGYVQGLRIDHVDGLADPDTYLARLRRLVGEDVYLVVEKILEEGEALSEDWDVQGTSGYDFLATVNRLFTDPEGWQGLEEVYQEIVPEIPPFGRLLPERKYFILKKRMHGELENLYHLLTSLQLVEKSRGLDIKEALARLMSAYPVYRMYSQGLPFEMEEAEYLTEAFDRVEDRYPKLKESLDALRPVFAPDLSGQKEFDGRRMHFLKRWQQFTGPLAAKGGEDTSFYIFHRLISRNEVGDSPSVGSITVQAFHHAMKVRARKSPYTMNSTSTHDTKRGEDSRMRLNVLSELSEEWAEAVVNWKALNNSFRTETGPDANDEYFLYQVLLGLWPMGGDWKKKHRKRLEMYLSKALREAKVHTSWSEPNETYENSLIAFANRILDPGTAFYKSFGDFLRPVIKAGALNSMAQLLIKHTAPGIPDTYQGCEFWDLSLVDPDNRRKINYNKRKNALKSIKKEFSKNSADLADSLLRHFEDGEIKLFITWRLLQLRRQNDKFFRNAKYEGLELDEAEEFVGYQRFTKNKSLIVVCPLRPARYLSGSGETMAISCPLDFMPDFPESFQGPWLNLFTGKEYDTIPSLSQLFAEFPLVCLVSSQMNV